ncbi:MAG: M56 family metallopeptidase [Polyangiaceae bacterium]|nr:M56 family metallopeptidase [Polyangiaceae bacterium]
MTAVLVSSAAVFVVLTFGVGLLVAALSRIVPKRAWTRASTPWALSILLPLVVALAGSLALFLPTPFSACHCAAHDHHPHICFAHPALAAPLLAPASVLLGVWLLGVLPGAVRLSLALVSSARRIRAVRQLTPERVAETEVRFVDSGVPTAFTAGVRAPIIVLDRAMWASLGERHREVVLYHERGHVDRADPLTSLVLRASLVLQPWLPRSLFERWQHAAELDCDRHAAEHVGDPSAVAAALVSVGRLRSALPVADEALSGVFGSEGLEARVTALLDDEQAPGSSRRNDVIAILIPLLGVLALVTVWPGDLLHHAVETVIGFLHH